VGCDLSTDPQPLSLQDSAAHDIWFRRKVQESINDLDRGDATLYDHDELFDELETRVRAYLANSSR
jgi:hypothetical protein